MAKVLEIADAMVGALTGGSFPLPFTAERAYAPDYSLEDMAACRVAVVPRGLILATASRGSEQQDYLIDIGILRKTDGSQQDLDALMGLVEAVAEYFGRAGPWRYLAGPQAYCVAVKMEPLWSPEHLRELRQFTAVLSLTWRVWRDV